MTSRRKQPAGFEAAGDRIGVESYCPPIWRVDFCMERAVELLGGHVCAEPRRGGTAGQGHPAETGAWASLAARGLHKPVLFWSRIPLSLEY